jgi:L-ascorbate metabolism protein UlaG (beta-lactamase superfamily)
MREVLGSTAAGLGLVAAVMGHVGWFAPPRAWGEATGWSAIPVEERPSLDLAWPDDAGEAPEVHWLGHSGFLIVWHGVRILLDPNTSPRVILAPRILEAAAPASMLGAVDAVLVSHAHYDHLDLPTIAALPSVRTILVPVGSETYLRGARSDARVVGLDVWETERIGPVEVIAVPAAHNGSRFHPLPSRHLAVGWVLRAGGGAIYYAGDTGLRNDFAAIARTSRIDLAILPIGAYAPSFPMRRYHLSPEDAVEVARILDARAVVPCHFGTFVLALDAPNEALPRFARAARAAGLRWTPPRLLTPFALAARGLP